MKPLKPSHREDKRYVLIKGKSINQKIIDEIILEFIGILGYAEASPQIIKSDKNQVILSINKGSLDKIKTSFIVSNSGLEVVQVSGSVKKLK